MVDRDYLIKKGLLKTEEKDICIAEELMKKTNECCKDVIRLCSVNEIELRQIIYKHVDELERQLQSYKSRINEYRNDNKAE